MKAALMIDDTINESCFAGYSELIHELTGITIRPERQTMLVGRLRKRVRALNLADFEEYLEYVKDHKDEHELFVNQITTNETYFFRTPRIWDYIERTFLPQWIAGGSTGTFHAWSAAASTGEEAHTLGVLLQQFKADNPGFDYRVHGTDIDTSVLKTASQGLYNGRSIERFRDAKPDWFETYMTGTDTDGYSVIPEIKQKIKFSKLNLFDTVVLRPEYDLVLVRNVLIYFTAEDQEKVMATVYRKVKPEGLVIIGESESLNNIRTSFEPIAPTFYRPASERVSSAA